ncbi:MAG: 4-hydroxy-3-methylbut-2-enyl diphosphate reductase, partial [Bacilli bacterium]
MNVQEISPRGYCYGVVNAIKIATNASINHPHDNIYVIGMIVHNKYITKALQAMRITTLDDTNKSREALIDDIDHGIIVLTAHGSALSVKEKALRKGLIVYDATCMDVLKT